MNNFTKLKKFAVLFVFAISFMGTGVFAQSPNAFKYQAVLRDLDGKVLANEDLSVEISLLQGSETGTAVLTEVFAVTTNMYGLTNLEIGSVNPSGFGAIDWGNGPYFIKVSVDGDLVGTSQLLSVPYALHAGTVDNDMVDDADADATNELQDITLVGNQLTLSMGSTVTLPGNDFDGEYSSLEGTPTKLSDFTNDPGFITNPDDADADPMNELQILSISGNQLTLSDGNTVTIPASDFSGDYSSLSGAPTKLTDFTNDAGFINNPNDADSNPVNEIQVISILGNKITLSNGGFVFLPAENDPLFTAWDKSSGISISESQISDLNHFTTADETDPDFNAWDKTTGIVVTESQISDLTHFTTADETDPDFNGWDKSTGIEITESQISDLTHFTSADETDPAWTAEKSNYYTTTQVEALPISTFDNDAGYVTSISAESDPVWAAEKGDYYTVTDVDALPISTFSNDEGYITAATAESDPVFVASPAGGIAGSDISNWNTAYVWGDHSTVGYFDKSTDDSDDITEGSTNLFDKTVSITGGGINVVTGIYPNFTITATDLDVDNTNEIQDLSLGIKTGTSQPIIISDGGTGVTIDVADNDDDSSNEFQSLSLGPKIGTSQPINISDGTGITIDVADNDDDSSNEIQSLTGSGATLSGYGISLNLGGGSVILPNEADGSITNEVQDLSLSGNTLSLTQDLTPVDISTATAVFANTGKDTTGIYHVNRQLLDVIDAADTAWWGRKDILMDADKNTKVQVEKTPNDNIIRFDIDGAERWRMQGARLEPVNTQNNTAVGVNSMIANTLGTNNSAFGYAAMAVNTEGQNNVAVGFNALLQNTEGKENTAIGAQALFSNTTGDENTANGYFALYKNEAEGHTNTAVGHLASFENTTGDYNVSVGAAALLNSTIGDLNTAIGSSALVNNVEGSRNTAIGSEALSSNTNGSYNVAVGSEANFYNEEGNGNTSIGYQAGKGLVSNQKEHNVFIGYQAGFNTSVGDNDNIFIGYQAGYSEESSDKLFIENSSSATPLIYGEFDNDLLKINGTLELANGALASSLTFFEAGGANYTKFQSQAQVADITYTLPADDGDADQVLQTDGNGILSWVDDGVKNPVAITSGTIDGTTITGGTIDGTTITTSNIDVTAGSLILNDDQISGDKVEGGTIGTVAITNANIGTATIATALNIPVVTIANDPTTTGHTGIAGDLVCFNNSTSGNHELWINTDGTTTGWAHIQ